MDKSCIACGNSSVKDELVLNDYFLTGEEFAIRYCENCGLAYTAPKPELEDISKYYKSDEYIAHSNTNKGLINRLYHLARFFSLKRKIHIMKRYHPRGNMLDIGCGTGEFLQAGEKAGYEVIGVEPDHDARYYASSILKLDVRPERALRDFSDDRFDIVTMWHVLEHVYDLDARMKEIKRILKNTGTLIVATPNYESYDAAYYGKYWAAWDVPRHLFHFSGLAMKKFMEKHGFDVVEVLPMKFDAFYVSMLSEKYKNGHSNFLGGMKRGFVSNLKAKGDNLGFSSQIYIGKLK